MSDETKEEMQKHAALMETLRDMIDKRKSSAPGTAAIEIHLSKIFHYIDADGNDHAVMPIEEVLYLVDDILRR